MSHGRTQLIPPWRTRPARQLLLQAPLIPISRHGRRTSSLPLRSGVASPALGSLAPSARAQSGWGFRSEGVSGFWRPSRKESRSVLLPGFGSQDRLLTERLGFAQFGVRGRFRPMYDQMIKNLQHSNKAPGQFLSAQVLALAALASQWRLLLVDVVQRFSASQALAKAFNIKKAPCPCSKPDQELRLLTRSSRAAQVTLQEDEVPEDPAKTEVETKALTPSRGLKCCEAQNIMRFGRHQILPSFWYLLAAA